MRMTRHHPSIHLRKETQPRTRRNIKLPFFKKFYYALTPHCHCPTAAAGKSSLVYRYDDCICHYIHPQVTHVVLVIQRRHHRGKIRHCTASSTTTRKDSIVDIIKIHIDQHSLRRYAGVIRNFPGTRGARRKLNVTTRHGGLKGTKFVSAAERGKPFLPPSSLASRIHQHTNTTTETAPHHHQISRERANQPTSQPANSKRDPPDHGKGTQRAITAII